MFQPSRYDRETPDFQTLSPPDSLKILPILQKSPINSLIFYSLIDLDQNRYLYSVLFCFAASILNGLIKPKLRQPNRAK